MYVGLKQWYLREREQKHEKCINAQQGKKHMKHAESKPKNLETSKLYIS